jgi:general L-amino acid transport system permease protein
VPGNEPTENPGTLPVLAPPGRSTGPLRWIRANLFSSWGNGAITVLILLVIYQLAPSLLRWAIFDAAWSGNEPTDCRPDAACWVYIRVWFENLLLFTYPKAEAWRVGAAFGILAAALATLLLPGLAGRTKAWLGAFLLFVYPFIAQALFYGGVFGLPVVETRLWGGLFLTLVIAISGIVGSLPIGVLLALGRRSKMPLVKAVCVAFIELWRSVPLLTVLFMASVMFPLFMPEGVNINKLLRAIVGATLFTAAYNAEVIRGGLQAIPRGQYEAASSLGLGYWKTMTFIIMPQAIKIVIPGLVNNFIGFFKDTSLVLIIGMFDFLGAAQAISTNPRWLGHAVEGYLFVGIVYFFFCFAMSSFSGRLERKLNTER